MKIDCVFSGGGVKAFAFIGAIESIAQNNFQIERTAGTSAGAIISGLLTAGYTNDEIRKMMKELDLNQFMDPPRIVQYLPFTKWLYLYFKLGFYKGEKLEQWIYEKLANKQIYTFRDIKPGYLKVVVSDLSLGKLVVIPDDLERVYGMNPDTFIIARAIRMSAGFPYFFIPKKITGKNDQKSIIVDGGLLSNFPLWIFERRHQLKRPILGLKLSTNDTKDTYRRIKHPLGMFQAIFSTMKLAHDERFISTSDKNNIIYISVKDVDTMDLELSSEKKEELIRSGRESTTSFLKHWPN